MTRPAAKFHPCAFYNVPEDALEVYVSPERFVADRLDSFLTFFLSSDRKEIRGFVLKNIRKHARKGGFWDSINGQKRIMLSQLVGIALQLWERTAGSDGDAEHLETLREGLDVIGRLLSQHGEDEIRFSSAELVGAG